MSRDIGQYKIFNQIGKGSFGKVYKGIDKLTGEEVALKFIQKKQKRPRDIKNLREENELLKKINHPNVILLKDVIQTPKEIIIVTDYAGRDLSGVIQQVKRFPLQKVKQFSLQILNAMVYLNQNRIIHRDLKPQNILIKNNHIKICDFGFAKKLSASTNFLQSMKGTPLYLAPQIVKETKYTEKVDIWSFGCIIYELFTGRTPYFANTYQKLAPLILYQQVQYPKDMPADLKDLICSMLQKNPSARPSWKQLKEHAFFKQAQVLKQKIDNGFKGKIDNELKQVVSIEIPDKIFLGTENKDNNQNKQNPQIAMIESKVIQKLDNQNQIKSYEEEFKKIYNQLVNNTIDGNELRRDIIFLHKIKTVFHQRSQSNLLISNQLLETIFNILAQLIKNKKNFTNDKANQNLLGQQDDITKNEALIIGILCLAKVQKNYSMLQKQLKIICLLIKKNFNGIAINTDIDEEITEFVTQILLQNSSNLPVQCIRNGLIIIGTITNQAFLTINNSFQFFERIAEDNVLSKIANIFKKEEKHATVLQCLKQFVHPIREIPSMTGNNPHYILYSRLQRVFITLKEQVSQSLLKTDFLSEKCPLQVYNQKNSHIIDYCEVLLQCLTVSKQMRSQFMKYNYWSELLNCKKTKMFIFAYNFILGREEGSYIISNEFISNYKRQPQQNKLKDFFFIQMSYDKLKKIIQKAKQKQLNVNPQAYYKDILQETKELLFIEQAVKSKSCKEIYCSLETTSCKFDEPLIQLFYSIAQELKNADNHDEIKEFIKQIFKRICQVTNPFKPNTKSFFNLMSLFTENGVMKNLRKERSIQLFFYECISDFIKRQQVEYLEVKFQETFIPSFIAKLIQCVNQLFEIESQDGHTLSQNALNLTKQIQSSNFYRSMFLENLKEQQFYEHLKYSHKIIIKTMQPFPDLINFLGVNVIPMCKHYISTKNEGLIIQMCTFLAQMAKDRSQFNNNILEVRIIKKFKEWLIQENYSQAVKEKVLYLIGNLAKKSQFFFGEFQAYSVLQAISLCLSKHYTNGRIFKNTIYSVGNISFYNQKFNKQIEPMIPYFAKAFETNDPHLKNNLISTVSNLLRFSNIYLNQLIKTGMMSNILKIASSQNLDHSLANSILSLIKKVLPYNEFYKEFGYKQLKAIYQRRQIFGGDNNEIIKKVKEILAKASQF